MLDSGSCKTRWPYWRHKTTRYHSCPLTSRDPDGQHKQFKYHGISAAILSCVNHENSQRPFRSFHVFWDYGSSEIMWNGGTYIKRFDGVVHAILKSQKLPLLSNPKDDRSQVTDVMTTFRCIWVLPKAQNPEISCSYLRGFQMLHRNPFSSVSSHPLWGIFWGMLGIVVLY